MRRKLHRAPELSFRGQGTAAVSNVETHGLRTECPLLGAITVRYVSHTVDGSMS